MEDKSWAENSINVKYYLCKNNRFNETNGIITCITTVEGYYPGKSIELKKNIIYFA